MRFFELMRSPRILIINKTKNSQLFQISLKSIVSKDSWNLF